MNILSLFDGMACGMLAMQKAGIPVDNYYAYEIDKYAIKTSQHNFPKIKQCGDVFKGDYTQYEGIDYLIGGSPCTFWSIAQSPDKRETTASGIGWELFSQYVRALHEAKPKFFIYENNKSMSKAIRESITEIFGFEPICINSARLSAQNRQRLYWVGKRNADGTYSKVDVEQPEDRGILLRDILDGVTDREKGRCVIASTGRTTEREYFKKNQGNMSFEPVGTTKDGKSYCLTQGYSNGSGENIGNYVIHTLEKGCKSMVAEPVACRCRGRTDKNGNGYAKYECRDDCKSNTLDTNSTNGNMVAEPVCIASRGRYSDTENRSSKTDAPTYQHYEARTDGKTNAVTTVSKDNLIGEPVCMRYERSERAKQLRKDYESGAIKHGYHEYHELQPRTDGKSNTLSTVQKDNPICEPVRCFTLPREDGVQTQSKQYRVYETSGKSTTLCAEGGGMGAKTGLYAMPVLKVREATKKRYIGVNCGDCFDYEQPNSKTRRGRKMDEKSNCLTTSCNFYQYIAYAVEFDENGKPTKAVSSADGKIYTVYEVKDGQITIKEKQYPIKLINGYYIIRKLTVTECKRLQTVPEWYQFPVSDTQAYKMLGNGWTVDVIVHLIEATRR